jgi:hypothetical protein
MGKRYVDIGHGTPDAVLWLYQDGRVETYKSESTHMQVWGHELSMKHWRGRFDPKTNECSIVPPENWVGDLVPKTLLDALEAKFGDTSVEMFNPRKEFGRSVKRRNANRA